MHDLRSFTWCFTKHQKYAIDLFQVLPNASSENLGKLIAKTFYMGDDFHRT